MTCFRTLLCFIFLYSFANAAAPASAEKSQNETIFPAGLISISAESSFSDFAFVIDKTVRTLTVYNIQGDLPRKIYSHPTDIGKNQGPKQKVNDHRTPEGIYFFHSNP